MLSSSSTKNKYFEEMRIEAIWKESTEKELQQFSLLEKVSTLDRNQKKQNRQSANHAPFEQGDKTQMVKLV